MDISISQAARRWGVSERRVRLLCTQGHVPHNSATIEGNGRGGRFLVNLELMKEGCPPIAIKHNDRLAYYDAFDGYHSGKRSQAMGELFLRYLEEQLTRYVAMPHG